MRTVYLDNNATTAVIPAVFEAMRPFYTEHYGNPSSGHHLGDQPASAVRAARSRIAAFLGCADTEIIFTGGGTEADNLAIRGIVEAARGKRHIITSAVEHSAVLNPVRQLESKGYRVTVLGVDHDGHVDLDALRNALDDETALVSVMFANNETGVMHPIAEIAQLAHARGVPLHIDAVQGVGKVPVRIDELGADLVSLSAHKFHGPKGVGALVVKKGTRWMPTFLGGSQERGRRPGTENVAGIVAMAAACDYAQNHFRHYDTVVRALRDRFESNLSASIPDVFVNGQASNRIPNTSNMGFPGLDAHALLVRLDEVGICASAGSACHSGATTPSHVLVAMGLTPAEATCCIRFSLSTMTTDEDIAYCTDQIPRIVQQMRRNFISA
ncbi:MAG TPA: aminotransferase class V-fold PLP-dependent enzyme [Candidatus Krumholzibacteria bacterium]|nr:aminotransferase class V-fold PLP-dependent enzyme [Candidatus Krumholzibacteria bacterium]